jgi:isopentenyl-diphosphate delta-isomerase
MEAAHGTAEVVMERVILVDERDRPIGSAGKLAAHEEGLLHRAFSILVMNDARELLLQQRATGKYHSAGLWSNSCCSHPRPDETVLEAGRRRLHEELGFVCPLRPVTSFVYHADVGAGLTEHELDHVLVGRWDGEPTPDPTEVDDWRWAPLDAVRREVDLHPERFTVWFRLLLERIDDATLLSRLPPGEQVA